MNLEAQAGIQFSWAKFNVQHTSLSDKGLRCDPELALRYHEHGRRPVPSKLGQDDQIEPAA